MERCALCARACETDPDALGTEIVDVTRLAAGTRISRLRSDGADEFVPPYLERQ